ncbi:MAG: 4Fe-4S binding protein [Candidatus Eremiobacteraeota bacterium]|nr:4Fe-4S binding protein [Candidatus Eremiobacteraeota bacterium]
MKEWTREDLERDIVGKMRAVTIPVNIRIEGEQRILDTGEIESILRKAHTITQNECGCRKMMGNCNPPIEPGDGCLGINETAEDIKKYGAREISLEQAIEGLRRTYRAGLVHMAYIFPDQETPFLICSCCECCCHSLGAARRLGYKNQVFPSRLVAVQDMATCSSCGTCVERCHFGARKIGSDVMEYSPEKCYGCGLCLETCPSGAISMEKRDGE